MQNEKILPVPDKIKIKENSQNITISYVWYKPLAWFLIVFATFWNAFMIFWMLADTPWFFKAFGLLHAAVGIGLIWYILCLFFNKTEISVSKSKLTILHSPIPFPTYKNIDLDKKEIKQVYVKQNLSKTKNGLNITYQLFRLDGQNKSSEMMNADDPETAFFIKGKIEQFFGIVPQAIAGEYLG